MYTEKDELSQAPFLKKLKDTPSIGMTVPDGYFDELQENVLAKISAEKALEKHKNQDAKGSTRTWSLWSHSKYVAVAASVVLLVLLVGLWWKPTSNSSEVVMDGSAPVDITAEEAEAYIMQHLSTLEEDELGMLADAALATKTNAKESGDSGDLPSDEEANDLLKNMTDEELEKLLN